jgi:hypothetical protein
MVHLKEGVSVIDAKKLIETIPHEICQTGLRNGHFAPNGYLDDPSIFWLYCWANNGDTSDNARDEARRVWNAIFDIPYEAFNESEFYEIAKKGRYE